MRFIEVTNRRDGTRIAINADTIHVVDEVKDHCHITILVDHKKTFCVCVKESYHTVTAMLREV